MKIKKLAQCCLVVEVGGKRIITDPGSFSTEQNEVTGVDAIVITHEHGDHFHAESVQAILKNNPAAVVITNSGVGKKLDELGVPHTIVEGHGKTTVAGVAIEAFDWKHEEIFEEMGMVQNTGYLIEGLLLPGDAYCVPAETEGGAAVKVDILALPVGGPWCRIPDALHYAIKVKPRIAFPVHDAMLKPSANGFVYTMVENILKEHGGIAFSGLHDGNEAEL
jgi:L-ascorbate metabolism protein UlaG (beta-lactamase superfamily)